MLSALPGISIISQPAVDPALDSTRRTGVLFAAGPGELKPRGVSVDVSGALSADLNTMHREDLSTWGPSEFARKGLEWDPAVFYLSRFCPK
jgi:hypothetical protein